MGNVHLIFHFANVEKRLTSHLASVSVVGQLNI